jgi:hypothetical protein
MATSNFWFKFDETSGQYAVDSVSGYQAKMYDSVAGDRGVTFSSGKLLGDGSNSSDIYAKGAKIIESSYATDTPTVFTIGLRFATSSTQQKPLLCYLKNDGSTQENLALVFDYDSGTTRYVPIFHAWRGDPAYAGIVTTITEGSLLKDYNDGIEHSVIVTCGAGGFALWVDTCSVVAGTNAYTPYDWSADPYQWQIGGGGDGLVNIGACDGALDDVRYWTRVLTTSEICTFMAGGDPDAPVLANPLMFSFSGGLA